MAWSPPALERWSWLVEQAGDYAAPISHHIRDDTRGGAGCTHDFLEQRTNRGARGQAEDAEAADLRTQQLRPAPAPRAPHGMNHASCGRATKPGQLQLQAVVRLVGAILLEESDEWSTQRARSMTLETIDAVSDTAPVSLSAVPA
jgi:hypothetical protein